MTNELILITGVARSGISLIAGVIECCGAWGGKTVRSTRADRHGSLENIEIRDFMVKPLLRGVKADPVGQMPLPDMKLCCEASNKVAIWWRKKFWRLITEQGYKANKGPVFFVNPQSCLIWSIWAASFPEAKWVIVRRRDEEIIQSCLKTGYMKAHKDGNGWQIWINAHKDKFAEMVAAKLDIWQIWIEGMLRGDLTQAKLMIEHLDLHWNEDKVSDCIAPVLWKEGVFELAD